MARTFLIRGLLCGLVAGLLVFICARLIGEPSVDGAIGVENQLAKAAGEMPEPELVSRAVQASWGLLTGVMLYSVAVGGLFSLAFAFAWRRAGRLGARATSALLAGGAFVAVYLVPFLKYPANPPSVGNAETIGIRTALYFGMIVISIVAALAALNLGRSLARRFGTWNAVTLAAAMYLVLVLIANLALPKIDEVPTLFPATLLWQFRMAALGMQAILWTTLGLGFGWLTERKLAPEGGRLRRNRSA